MTSPVLPRPPRPAVHLGRLILIFGLLTAFAPFATDMYLAGFPDIAQTLGCRPEQVQLTLSTFVFGMAIGQLFYGPIIDRFGRRRPLIGGLCLFTVSSLAIIWSPDITSLVALRFLEAVGGCAGMIISRAVIQDLFDPQEAAQALSAMMMVQGVGPIAAPVLGGFLLTLAHWEAIFVFLSMLGAGVLVLVVLNVPETHTPASRQPLAPGSICAGFWRLLVRPGFIVPALSSSISLSCMFAFITGSPFVLMNLHGVSQRGYGLLFGFVAVCMMAFGQINRVLLRRHSAARLYAGSLLVNLVAGLVLVSLSSTTHLVLLMIPLCACLAMVPVMGANGVALAMAQCGEQAGSASSLVGAMQFALAGVVSALVGVLHNGTAYPMTGMILACSVVANLVFQAFRRVVR